MWQKKVRGRIITTEDVSDIKALIIKHYDKGRKYISKELSRHWQWYQPNGKLKDMSCRYLLLWLEDKGYIKLPPRKNESHNERRRQGEISVPPPELKGKLKDFGSAAIKLVDNQKERELWNNLVQRYHYQGYKLIVGSFLKYLAYLQEEVVACLGWGSAAWNVECRDKYIGWSKEIKDKQLPFIVNNVRFLILPAVKVKYLASHLLALSVKRIAKDWQKQYGHPIYLLETFVEKERFAGTSYKAANWIYVGETKGHAKRGNTHSYHGSKKMIFVYPLVKNFREMLCQC